MGCSIKTPVIEDCGYVIIDNNTFEYFCSLNKWDKQLRKAVVYHSEKWANEVVKKYEDTRDLSVCKINIKLDGGKYVKRGY